MHDAQAVQSQRAVRVTVLAAFFEEGDVESSKVSLPQTAGGKAVISATAASPNGDRLDSQNGGAERAPASPGKTKLRKLIADQRYFGLEARALRVGAERMLRRMSAQASGQAWINVRSIGEDFALDATASGTLLRAFLAGGLLYPDGDGGYYATPLFREYALAQVVSPLSRSQARELLNRACHVSAVFNADSRRNPFLIRKLFVSGSYMSRSNLLPELSLWIELRRRAQPQAPLLDKEDALRQIRSSISEVSPVIELHLVSDDKNVPRPFSVLLEGKEDPIESAVPAWEKIRNWSASIGQRVVSRPDALPASYAPMELVTLQRQTIGRQKAAWGNVGKRG